MALKPFTVWIKLRKISAIEMSWSYHHSINCLQIYCQRTGWAFFVGGMSHEWWWFGKRMEGSTPVRGVGNV